MSLSVSHDLKNPQMSFKKPPILPKSSKINKNLLIFDEFGKTFDFGPKFGVIKWKTYKRIKTMMEMG